MSSYRDHPLYSTWKNMKTRCLNPANHKYKDYGGRGITICQRWADSFMTFAADMGERPAGFSLERKDNNGNYTPANCKWASVQEQALNKRPYKLKYASRKRRPKQASCDSSQGNIR